MNDDNPYPTADGSQSKPSIVLMLAVVTGLISLFIADAIPGGISGGLGFLIGTAGALVVLSALYAVVLHSRNGDKSAVKEALRDRRPQAVDTTESYAKHETSDFKWIKEELLRTQEALHQAQKMEALGQLAGGLAHDFNNHLTAVMANIELLEERLESDTESQGFARAALDAAKHGAVLVKRVLAFSRRQILEPCVTDVNQLVQGTVELLRRILGEKITIETVLAPVQWQAFIDPRQLETALVNLAVNARDAMPSGGKLTIKTSNARLDEYAAASENLEAGAYVMLEVTDAGTGMSPDQVKRVFEPFFTTKKTGEGSGLGLSMVYGFAKQSGGHVAIYSEHDQGTTVKLYLQRAVAKMEAIEQRPEIGRKRQPRGETILVVEDDRRVRAGVVSILKNLGYKTLQADNGEAALAVLGKNPHVALLFCDIVMPGMDGIDVARVARARRPELKVLYTTGYGSVVRENLARQDTSAELIEKPFLKDRLANRISAVLGNA